MTQPDGQDSARNDSGRTPELKATTYAVVDRTAVVTLNRPHRGNAWTGRMHAEYRHCLQTADEDPSVRAIIVTGAGDKFCVGGDAEALGGHADRGNYDDGLDAATTSTDAEAHRTAGELSGATLGSAAADVHSQFAAEFAYHFGVSKPIIAALNGAAAGIGLALACFADLRFAAPGAKLTTAHGKLALPPEYGLSWLLPRQIGLPRAMEVLLTSRVFSTDEAHEWGLVTALASRDQLLDTALEFCRNMVGTVASASLTATREMVYNDLHRGVGESVIDSLARLDAMMGSADYRKGVRALTDRRPAEF